LNRAPILEDPEEFAEWIRQHVKPARGRQLHVEVLHGTWDFQAWFGTLDAQISGLAATHTEPNTNHSWTFARYSLLNTIMPQADTEVEVAHETWKDLPADSRDCILLVKQYMHDAKYSQKPILMQPYAIASSLNKSDLKPVPRNELGERAIKEFRKTATAVCQQPWNLLKAGAYLKQLCDSNEDGVPGTPPTLDYIFRDKFLPSTVTTVLSGDVGLCDGRDPPRRVVVMAKKAAAKGKPKPKPKICIKRRPAAAANKRPAAAPPPGADDAADEAADYSTSTPPTFKMLHPFKQTLNSRNPGFLRGPVLV
jgi:hypothetical protein